MPVGVVLLAHSLLEELLQNEGALQRQQLGTYIGQLKGPVFAVTLAGHHGCILQQLINELLLVLIETE